jgi:hypothetical protein
MNAKKLVSRTATVVFASLGLTLVACGGRSGGPVTAPPTASINVQPGSFDFGLVTEGNLDEVPARRFTIRNNGTSSYSLSSIRLEGEDPADFDLNVNAGDTPCGAAVRSLSPGASCEVEVRFAARDFGTFSATLVVQSDDPVAPTVSRTLQGRYAEVLAVNVAVSQVSACPRELPAKVFVSVTDQAGFPIRGLGLPAFSLQELGTEVVLDSVNSVADTNASISLSIVMDYSSSITRDPETVDNMEEAAGILVEKLTASDEADIVKYADVVKFMLEDFSSDKAELLAAIAEDPGFDRGTAFYDATLAAVERIKDRVKVRKAIISLTDGVDTRSMDSDLATVIEAAIVDDIPVFTVGFGDVNALELGKLADDTGGIYYEPAASDNLSAVYQQLANLIIDDQYVLSYLSGLPADESASLQVSVEFIRNGVGFMGSGSKLNRACSAP